MTPPNIPAWLVVAPSGTSRFDTHEQAEEFAAKYAHMWPGQDVVLYAFQRNFRHAPLSLLDEPSGTLQ